MAESSSEAGNASASLSPGGEFLFNISTDKVEVVELVMTAAVTVAALRAPDRTTAITLGALYFGYKLVKPLVDAAVKKALGGERDDQEVRDIRQGSLLVELHCFTDERFLEVLGYYESGEIKKRLEEEFSQIGIKVEGLKVEIENLAEVNETKEAINKSEIRSYMDAEAGYDPDHFISKVPLSLVCGICKQVVREPRLCKDGEHCFCFSCISLHLNESQTCPVCTTDLTAETLVAPQECLKRVWRELQIKCDYVQRGCSGPVQLGNLEDHVSHCGFAPVTCEKCRMQLNRKDKDNHEKSFCQLGGAKCQECENVKANQDEMKQELCQLKARLAEMEMNANLVPAQLNEIMNERDENVNELKRKHDQIEDEMKSHMSKVKRKLRKIQNKGKENTNTSMAARGEDVSSYDVDRFVGQVKEDLLCSICKCVPKDPRLCENNDHIFCFTEISRHLEKSQTCPYCREPLTLETLRRPTGFLKNSLDDLKIKCDHHDRGCPDELSLEGLPRHVDQCGYAPVMCGNEGCEMVVNKRDKDNHEKSVCQFRIPKWHEIEASQDEMKIDFREMKHNFELFIEKFNRVPDVPLFSTSNKEIIIMGGKIDDVIYDSVSVFNPANGTYAKLPPMNSPRHSASSCVYKNEVIVAGGVDGNKAGLDTIEILKINQDLSRWTTSRGKLPCRLYGHVLKVYQEKLLVIGGYDSDTKKVSNEIHELALDEPYTATLLATMPEPRVTHSAEIVNDKLFILGGVENVDDDDGGDILDSVVMYDFITKEFKTCEPLPKPVSYMSTVTWGNKIIVVGGVDKNFQPLNDVIMYDTETERSVNLPSLNHKRSYHSAVICDDVIFVFGGWNRKEGVLNSVESLKIDSDENWKELPSMREKRQFLTAVVKP